MGFQSLQEWPFWTKCPIAVKLCTWCISTRGRNATRHYSIHGGAIPDILSLFLGSFRNSPNRPRTVLPCNITSYCVSFAWSRCICEIFLILLQLTFKICWRVPFCTTYYKHCWTDWQDIFWHTLRSQFYPLLFFSSNWPVIAPPRDRFPHNTFIINLTDFVQTSHTFFKYQSYNSPLHVLAYNSWTVGHIINIFPPWIPWIMKQFIGPISARWHFLPLCVSFKHYSFLLLLQTLT